MDVLGEDVSLLDAYAAANDVLHGAVSGIAEVINNPGLVNVDFADVRTVMGEVGHGDDGLGDVHWRRPRDAWRPQQAVKSPLLEDVNLAGARGVLVNITASAGLKMKEYHEVMNTIKEFTADDAMVIVGTVIDDAMEDDLRVTMIATGLGRRSGGHAPSSRSSRSSRRSCRAHRHRQRRRPRRRRCDRLRQAGPAGGGRGAAASRRAVAAPAFDASDIPAFLRKQAD